MQDGDGRSAEQPKVSALVPAYNAAAFIQATLDSLAAQTWGNLEILIADDRSPDNTLEIVNAFAAARPNVRVLARTENLGWLRNTNDLMSRATGELMFFAFHDDILAPSYVEKLAGALIANPAAVLAYSDMEQYRLDMTKSLLVYDQIAGRSSALARAFIMSRRQRGWYVPNRGLFRTWAYEAIGGIKPNREGEFSADWTWLLHMTLLGAFVRVPEVLCFKYFKPGSISKSWSFDRRQHVALLRAGVAEIAGSSAPLPTRLALTAHLRARILRHRVAMVREALRRPPARGKA